MPFRRIVVFSILMITLWNVRGTAQTGGHDLYFNNVTEQAGVSPAILSCMIQDKSGYLWFGTHEGLCRYDGYKVERYTVRSGTPNTLSDNYITGLAQDKAGAIWVGTISGLDRYDPAAKRFTSFEHFSKSGSQLLTKRLTRLFTDSKNRLWIGYSGEGWAVYDITTNKLENYRSAAHFTDQYGTNAANTATWFSEDDSGNLWICTNYGLHCQDRQGRVTTYNDRNRNNAPQNDNLFTFGCFTDDTTLWLGTWGAGLKRFNTRTKEFSQYIFDKINPLAAIHDIVLAIACRSKDELWVGTADKGLGIFNIHTGAFRFLPHSEADAHSPLPGECYMLLKDGDGTLWAGYYDGLSSCTRQSQLFTHVPLRSLPTEYKTHTTVYSFYKDPSDLLYAGCIAAKGLYIIDEKTGDQKVTGLPRQPGGSLDETRITSLVQAGMGQVALASNSGLYMMDTKRREIKSLPLRDQENKPLYNTVELIKGLNGYWCNTGFNNGFYRIREKFLEAIHYYNGETSPVRFSTNDVGVLLEESDTTLWIRKRDVGLGILNVRTNVLETVRSVAHEHLFGPAMICEDGDHYWVASYEHGLFYLTRQGRDTFACKQFGETEGLPSEFINDLIRDTKGNLWVATKNGPAVLKKGCDQFINFSAGNFFSSRATSYPAIWQAGDGYIYLGALLEYVKWQPDSLLASASAPILHLTSLKIFDKEWNDTTDLDSVKQLQLPYDRNYISVGFTALALSAQSGVQYMYRMEGIDDDWVKCGDRRYLSYSLPPGNYILRLKAVSSMQQQSNELKLQITIRPPFWRTWWFIATCLLLCGGIISAFFLYRIAQVKREARIKADLNKKIAEIEMKALRAQMNPHFLFNCLNSINRYIVINESVKASNYLTKFSKLIRLILDNSANDTTTLENEINLLKLYIEMESMRFEGKFTYSVSVDAQLEIETVVIPSMIIQPYVENAIWHGLLNKPAGGHLGVSFKSRTSDELEVIIEDNGIGRKKAQELKSKSSLKNKSYGMQITNDRIKVLNQLYDAASHVQIEDLDNGAGETGTRVTLHIPYHLSKTGTNNGAS